MNKTQKIKKIIKTIQPYLEKSLASFTPQEKKGREKVEELTEILESLKICFTNISSSELKDKEKIQEIKQFLLLIYSLNLEEQIEDVILRRTAKTIKRDIIKRRSRERLAEYIAEILYSDWKMLSLSERKKIVSFLNKKMPKMRQTYRKVLLDLFLLLAPYTLNRLSSDEFNNFINLVIKLLKNIEEKKNLESILLKINQYLLERLDIIKGMRKAFTGLLLSDLLLFSLSRSLGLRQRLTLTDFIIILSVKIQEKQIFNNLNLNDAQKLRRALQKVNR